MDFNTLGSFDANQHAPKQLSASVPPGKYPFQINNTAIVPTKEGDGGMFVVEFNTPSGVAIMRYNLWNPNPKAVEIAHGQLSALCHAVGIFKVDFPNQGAALRGAQGMVEIGWQKGNEPTPEKPEGGYTEVKRVYDRAGNEPGKAPAAAPQTQPAWGQQSSHQQSNPNPAQAPAWQPGPSQGTALPTSDPPWVKK